MPGRIITFYSYKGGTGRSMALANIAWILASNRLKVLVIDWDLEAPGLHRYFHPFLPDKELANSKGVIDLFIEFASAALTVSPPQEGPEATPWYLPYANIMRHAVSLNWNFTAPGTIDFVPAGRQDASYALRVNSFHWDRFYDKLGGGLFLEAVKQRIRSDYDYILIDSRTGVSDTAGICTIQMPDDLVVCFTLNIQSLAGAAAAAESAYVQRRRPDGSPGLGIFPVPMRVEAFEKQKLELARDAARARFDIFLGAMSAIEQDRYWGSVEVPYQPFYAYEEILSTFGDRPNRASSMLAAMERITNYITAGHVTENAPVGDSERQEVLRRYSGAVVGRQPGASPGEASYAFYLGVANADWDQNVKRLHADLLEGVRTFSGLRNAMGFVFDPSVGLGDLWFEKCSEALKHADVLVVLISPAFLASAYAMAQLNSFRSEHRPVIPLVWIEPRASVALEAQEMIAVANGFLSPFGFRELWSELASHEKAANQVAYREFLKSLAARVVELPMGPEIRHEALPIRTTVVAVVVARSSENAVGGPEEGRYGERSLDWLPFFPGNRRPAELIIREMAWQRQVPLQIIPLVQVMLLRERNAAGSLAVVVIDVRTLLIKQYLRLVNQLIEGHSQCSLVYCIDNESGEEARGLIRDVGNEADMVTPRTSYFAYSVGDLDNILASIMERAAESAWRTQLEGEG